MPAFDETLLEPAFDESLLIPETQATKGQRLRAELAAVREEPGAATAPEVVGDVTRPEFAGIPEYQMAYHTPIQIPRFSLPEKQKSAVWHRTSRIRCSREIPNTRWLITSLTRL